jgi:hypothetical protein
VLENTKKARRDFFSPCFCAVSFLLKKYKNFRESLGSRSDQGTRWAFLKGQKRKLNARE